MHDGYMNIVAVSNDQLLRYMTERLLCEGITRTLSNPKMAASSENIKSLAGFDNVFWMKFKALLVGSGLTCAIKDIAKTEQTIILEAWAGYPEWSDRLPGEVNKKIVVKYSFAKSQWYLSIPREKPFAYRKEHLTPFQQDKEKKMGRQNN